MQWKKLGHIFDPREHQLPNGCKEFAQSPQALVLEDRIRIYFSTRAVDPVNNKFLSHVAFVDMDKNLEKTLGVSQQTVIPLGERGCFDEHGIFPFSVGREGDRIVAYTCGWNRRVSVSVDTATGYAVSDDTGLTFKRNGPGPVLGPSLQEPFLVGDSFVRQYNDKYHMWYIAGLRWVKEVEQSAPDRVYKIRYATSVDGQRWTQQNENIIADVLHENECQALPSVLKIGDTYHMVFCFRDVFGFRKDPSKGYRLGYATSRDLIHWDRDDKALGLNVSSEDWYSSMMCYPHIFEADGKIYLLYNGNEFGRAGFGAAVMESL